MLLVDVHSHLWHEGFTDLDKVIGKAEKAGLKSIIVNGLDPKTNLKTLYLSKKYKIIKPAFGLYPLEVVKLTNSEIEKELEFIKENKPIAVGEIGLDYCFGKKDELLQKQTFEKIIKVAQIIEKPVIVHSRKAEQDVVDILEELKIKKVVLHCFEGGMGLIKRAENNGWHFSIPFSIARKKHFELLVKKVSVDKLLTETDAPFQAPDPCFVEFIVSKIAEIKGLNKIEVANNIYKNYQKLFL